MADTTDRSMARRGVLRHPALRSLLVAELISSLGTQMTLLALPWFVLMTWRSATLMGLVLAVELLPAALLGIPSAVVVQRIGPRRTMLYANLFRTPLLAAVPSLHVLGLLPFPMLLALVFGVGLFSAPYMSAKRLLIPETFADESLVVQGNAVVEGVARLGMLLGPAVAGVAIPTVGSAKILYFDAASFLIAYLILRRLPRWPTESDRPTGLSAADGRGVLAGARYALANPLLRRITTASLLFGFFFPPLLASLPVLTAKRYDGDPRIAGLLFAAYGGGAMLGTLSVLPFANRIPPIRLGAAGAVGLSIPLWLVTFGLPQWPFALALFVSGLFTPMLNAPVITLMTLSSPTEVRAKVVTFILTTNLLAGPLAYALTGPALDWWGLTPVYLGVALGVSAAAAQLVMLAVRPTDPRDPVPRGDPGDADGTFPDGEPVAAPCGSRCCVADGADAG